MERQVPPRRRPVRGTITSKSYPDLKSRDFMCMRQQQTMAPSYKLLVLSTEVAN